MRDPRQFQNAESADFHIAKRREPSRDIFDNEAMLTQLFVVAQQLVRSRDRSRAGERHRRIAATVGLEKDLGRRAGD